MTAVNRLGIVNGFPEMLFLLILLGASLALIFAGKSVFRVLGFVVVGLVGASVGVGLFASFGTLGVLSGAMLGFVIGGLLGLLLMAVGIGVALGYVTYQVVLYVFGDQLIGLVAAIVLFAAGVAFSGKILTVVSSILGALLLFDIMQAVNAGIDLSFAVSILAAAAGIVVQNSSERRHQALKVAAPGAQ